METEGALLDVKIEYDPCQLHCQGERKLSWCAASFLFRMNTIASLEVRDLSLDFTGSAD